MLVTTEVEIHAVCSAITNIIIRSIIRITCCVITDSNVVWAPLW